MIIDSTSPTDPIRVLMYSHDSQGLGHVRRNLTLAHHIASYLPGATGREVSGLLLTGLAPSSLFPLPQGFDWVTIPGIAKGANGYQARNLNVATASLIDVRSAIIQSTLLSYQPDLVIIDRHIFGVWKELRDPLIALRTTFPHTRIVLGMREVLDSPEVAAAEWDKLGEVGLLDELIDEVWVYGDHTVHDPVATGELPRVLAHKVRYTGYLSAGRSLVDGDQPMSTDLFILTTVGGGEDGFDLAYAASTITVPAGYTHIIVTGPQMDDHLYARVQKAAATKPSTRVIRSWPGLSAQIANASAVIAMGGYNTTSEILATDTPALIIPRETPRKEQLIRAQALHRAGVLDYLRINNLGTKALETWVHRAVGHSIDRSLIARDGLRTAAVFAHTIVPAGILAGAAEGVS